MSPIKKIKKYIYRKRLKITIDEIHYIELDLAINNLTSVQRQLNELEKARLEMVRDALISEILKLQDN